MVNDIKKILERNYKTCFHAFIVTKSENIKQDLHQRMDEICLTFSDYFDVSVLEAQASLQRRARELIKLEESQYD